MDSGHGVVERTAATLSLSLTVGYGLLSVLTILITTLLQGIGRDQFVGVLAVPPTNADFLIVEVSADVNSVPRVTGESWPWRKSWCLSCQGWVIVGRVGTKDRCLVAHQSAHSLHRDAGGTGQVGCGGDTGVLTIPAP